MKHTLCGIICFLVSYHDVLAQSDTTSRLYVGGSYFSEGGFYPGFTLNVEKSLLSNKNFELMAAGRIGAYFHYRNHTGVFLMVQSGQRIRLYRQLYVEHYLGIGFLQSFLNGGDAYYVDAIGTVHKARNTGNPHFMPSVSFGLSYSTAVKQQPTRFFVRPIIFWLLPFNQTALVQYGLEIGVLVKLKK